MSTPQAAVFDIGKVLLDFDFQRCADQLSPDSAMTPAEFRQLVDQSPLLHRYETGRLTSLEFYSEVRRISGYRGAFDSFASQFADIFTEIPQMTALLAEFRRRGIPTYIFSNTNELAVRWMRARYPFLADFNGFIFSFEVGAMKPQRPIYEALERLTGLSGHQLFYMDDRPENVEAGLVRGWRGVVHSDPVVTWRTAEEVFGWTGRG
jgi:glucose-1-phosphatase